MDLSPGSTFAGYTVIERLGRGGMGQVYLVENPSLQRREALKVISAGAGSPADFTERFAREARTAAALHHPGIITVYAYGVEGDTPWFTMRHLDGHDLSGQRLTVAEIAEVARQTAAALDYAHSHGVIHRDIKPANIFLTRGGDQRIESVTVLDFGIAKLADAAGLTGTNLFIGTLNYGAPELIAGQSSSPASDQYALACTLYELLTGAPPFVADNPLALLRAHGETPAPPISHRRPDLAALDPAFARALAKDPAQRFPTCTDFVTASLNPTGSLNPTASPHPAATAAPQSTQIARPQPPTVPQQVPVRPTPASPAPASSGHPHRPTSQATEVRDVGRPSENSGKRRRLLVLGAVLAAVVLLAGGITAYVLSRSDPAAESPVAGADAAAIQPISTGSYMHCPSNDDACTFLGTTCATADGAAYCWGDNTFGQLGDGTSENRTTPTRVPGLSNVTTITTNNATTCAIANSVPYCWGLNESGQLGDGTTENRTAPTKVADLRNAAAITTRTGTTCAIADGAAYCWGENGKGQVGDGTTEQHTTPTAVIGLHNPTSITTSSWTTCAIAESTPYCWGHNSKGQLGDGTTEERAAPTAVTRLDNASAIATGNMTTCAIVGDGNPYCWGNNENGQVGDGSTDDRSTPIRVRGLSSAIRITTGMASCAVSAGTAYCWGYNAAGNLFGAAPDNGVATAATRIPGLNNVTAITASNSTVCALADGLPYCWGFNESGQLGDGTTDSSATPVAVTLP